MEFLQVLHKISTAIPSARPNTTEVIAIDEVFVNEK